MHHSKICFKCNVEKPLSEYYSHSEMADGHLNKCKSCSKKDALDHRNANLDKIRAYDRDRAKNPERAKASARVNKAWRQADRRRSRCHSEVAKAIRNGFLEIKPCAVCGSKDSLAHHESYDRPLDVVWYCQIHHKARHKQMAIEGIEA